MTLVYGAYTTCPPTVIRVPNIDVFLDKSVNATELTTSLAYAVQHKHEHWFLS